jgi:hypothetical protein
MILGGKTLALPAEAINREVGPCVSLAISPLSVPEFSMGLETDISVFSTTIPKRCEVFSSLFCEHWGTFGEHFFEVRELQKWSSHFD